MSLSNEKKTSENENSKNEGVKPKLNINAQEWKPGNTQGNPYSSNMQNMQNSNYFSQMQYMPMMPQMYGHMPFQFYNNQYKYQFGKGNYNPMYNTQHKYHQPNQKQTTKDQANTNNNNTNTNANDTNTSTKTTGSQIKLKLTNSGFIPRSIRNNFKVYKEIFLNDIEAGFGKPKKMNVEYILSFENWAVCKENKLLSKECIDHIDEMQKTVQLVAPPSKKSGKKGQMYSERITKGKNEKESNKSTSSSLVFKRSEKSNETLQKWGRKDVSKEIAQAEKFKKALDDKKNKDPIKFELTELLNILTEDNYENTKKSILDIIQDNIEYQEKLLDVLFTKAVNETAFVALYAKLCKQLDKELRPKRPPKDKSDKKTSESSEMRASLLERCRRIFKKELDKTNEMIKADDPQEREIKQKKFVLGNVNFISELINVQILNKKIVFQCIEYLFDRYKNFQGDIKLKMINLEGIVILTDKFGTLLSKKAETLKQDSLRSFESKLSEIIAKLDEVGKENIPGYVKYKIINLVERSKAGWVESKYSASIVAKSQKEVQMQYEAEQAGMGNTIEEISQDEIGRKIMSDLKEYKLYFEAGNTHSYTWPLTEEIIEPKSSEFFQGFLDDCVDFADNEKNIEVAKSYFKDVIEYYSTKLKSKERERIKDKIRSKIVRLIKTAHDWSLDSMLILDVWAFVLEIAYDNRFIKAEDFDDLAQFEGPEMKSIMKILAKFYVKNEKLCDNFKKNFKIYSLNKPVFEEEVKKEKEKNN